MKKTKEEALETRKAIFQSALDLFYEKGYSKTTFEEIAHQIGLTKGAVYWHFKNKPDLLAALINYFFDLQQEYLKKNILKVESFSDIKRYFLLTSDFILNSPNTRKLAFFLSLQMEWSEAVITKINTLISENKKTCFELVKQGLTTAQKSGEMRQDFDSDLVASVILNLWIGTVESYFSKRCLIDLKVMISKSLDLLLIGLSKERIENADR